VKAGSNVTDQSHVHITLNGMWALTDYGERDEGRDERPDATWNELGFAEVDPDKIAGSPIGCGMNGPSGGSARASNTERGGEAPRVLTLGYLSR
jgi:hypothetical protein